MPQNETAPEHPDGDTTSILRRTVQSVVAGMSGLASSDRKEVILSVGRVFQALVAGQFLSQFVTEWEEFYRKGRIKDDYASTSQSRACLSELLRYLDSEVPDEKRLDLLKKIFLVAATEEVSDRESHLPQQFMQICRNLSTGEILVLVTTYAVADQKDYKSSVHDSAQTWLRLIGDRSGLKHEELVEIHEQSLMEKRLLTKRFHSDRSGVSLGKHFRLSDLGYELCRFLAHYDKETESGAHPSDG